jgi:hypothetical protein
MPATLVFHEKRLSFDGAILEMTIWRVPTPVPPSEHGLKYSLYFGFPGRRLVGFDNERGKGDHKHIGNQEYPYVFSSVERLIADFLGEVRQAGGEYE